MRRIKIKGTNVAVRVDDEDYPVLSRLHWYLSDTGYAITDSPVKHLKMHKLIIGPLPVRTVIDHIDRDKLNNQKHNLRVVSQKVNLNNTDSVENAKHYYFDNRRKRWTVDSRTLGVRYLVVKNPMIAERVVKRLKLGFPKNIALAEAHKQTIQISNWPKRNIDYSEYLKSKELGMAIREYRRTKSGNRTY